MGINLIEDRLRELSPSSQREELSALKEITQEVALCALARAGFFKKAAFQGGSCLRIIHRIDRFSEDLDFTLLQPQSNFVWEPFLAALRSEFRLYNLEFSAIDRSKADQAVKQAFLKDTSFGRVLLLTHPRSPADKQTIIIKLEIDTNPPAGGEEEHRYHDFPYPFPLTVQNLPSLFAGKCHALLCRPYAKGRDWYDFLWYIARGLQPNYAYLAHALDQTGPWAGARPKPDATWLAQRLSERVGAVDWQTAQQDAAFFVREPRRASIATWGPEFFHAAIDRWYAALKS